MSPRRPSTSAPSPPSSPDLPDELEALEALPDRLVDFQLREQLLHGLDLSERAARGLAMRDVIVEQGSWAGLHAESGRLERVEFRGVRLTGTAFSSASLTDVAFVDCRVDLASFRFAELRNIHFDGCRLDEADFYEAKLESVLFTGCDLTRASLAGATFSRSELRGCRLEAIGNPERLRGVRRPMPDLIQAADVLTAAVGIEIVD